MKSQHNEISLKEKNFVVYKAPWICLGPYF